MNHDIRYFMLLKELYHLLSYLKWGENEKVSGYCLFQIHSRFLTTNLYYFDTKCLQLTNIEKFFIYVSDIPLKAHKNNTKF